MSQALDLRPGVLAPSREQLPRPWGRAKSKNIFGWLCLAPYLLLLVVFGVAPMLYALFVSLYDPASGPGGIDSYVRALTDFRLGPAAINVGTFLIIFLPVMVGLVLVLSLAVHRYQGRFGSLVRLAYLLPGAVTGSASVLLWYVMMTPSLSPYGDALRALGFTSSREIFRPDNLPVMFALMAFVTGFGAWVLIFYGALQTVPHELIEAATLDGCNELQIAVRIKLPLMQKYIVFLLVLTFTASLQIFAEPALIFGVMKSGSPWWSINQVALTYAFQSGDFAAASALSLLLLVICAIAAALLISKTSFFESEAAK